ncbi:MAG: hypothetical protein ACI8PB_005466 [Desulforhopalus sp.]
MTISVFIIDVLQNESDGVNNSSIVINWLLIKRACALLCFANERDGRKINPSGQLISLIQAPLEDTLYSHMWK